MVIPLKNKKGVNIINAFQKILDSSKRKPNKIWVDQGREFYKSFFKKWLDDQDIKMYSTCNEGKSVVAERFIRTLKNKIYKHMTAVSKNVYFDVLNNIVDKYNNTYHRTIKMKPIDVKFDSYAEYNVDSNGKDPKFKISDHVRISKQKTFLLNYMLLLGQFHGLILLLILMWKKLLKHFMKKNCKRQIKKNLE